jgi:hypothetical protein
MKIIMELNELDKAFFSQLREGGQIKRDMRVADARNGTAFAKWWNETGQHLPQNNYDLAKDAWDAAMEAAGI